MAKTQKKTLNVKKKKGTFGLANAGHAIQKTKRIDNKKKKQKAAVERFIITDTKASEVLEVGQNVEVSWSGQVYEGKVLDKGSGGYLIHYKGWKQRFNDWVQDVKTTPKTRSKFFSIFEKKPKTEIINNTTPSDKKKSFTKVINSHRKIKLGSEDTENLSEYEKVRLANIREREAMFAQLAISEAKDDLRQALTPISANKLAASKRGLKSEKKVKDETSTPRRQSRRILGLSLTNEEEPSTEAEPEHIEEYPRLPLETIDCQETYSGDSDSSQFFLSNLSAVLSEGSSDKDPDLMTKSLENLTINEDRVAKVVPERIFSLDVHPGLGKLLAAAGGKSGGVGLWDVENVESATHGVHLFVPHSRPVNCLKWNKYNENQLISTSYDGTVRALDVEKQEHILLYADQDDNYTNLHCQTGPSTLLVSASNGEIVLVDDRVNNLIPVIRYRLFDRLISKSLDVHPVEQNYFLCGNNKGFCGVFDARSGGKDGGMITPVCQLSGHDRGLCSAMFSPVSGGKIASLAYDDQLRLYNSSILSGELPPIASVGHYNHTGRWLTPFKLHWRSGQEDILLMGSMERPRQMEVWRVDGDQMHKKGRPSCLTYQMRMEKALRGEQLGSVCSVVTMHPTKQVVIGGNSSGRVHVFM